MQIEGTRRWSSLTATARIVHCEGGHASHRHFERPTLLAILETVGGRLSVECPAWGMGAKMIAKKNHLGFVPAGASLVLRAPQVRFFREVAIELVGAGPCPAEGPNGDLEAAFAARFRIADRNLERVAELVAADCLSGLPPDPAYGDGLSVVLLKAIARLDLPGRPRPRQGGLAPWQLHRVMACLEAHLADGVSLRTLAELVDLSTSYLIRAFKASTGVTPHQWLRAARVRRAQHLLADGSRSLAMIAQETGFVDQAHLTRIFGQIIGETPGAWRRARMAGP